MQRPYINSLPYFTIRSSIKELKMKGGAYARDFPLKTTGGATAAKITNAI